MNIDRWDEDLDLKGKTFGREKGRLVGKVTFRELARALSIVSFAGGRSHSCILT